VIAGARSSFLVCLVSVAAAVMLITSPASRAGATHRKRHARHAQKRPMPSPKPTPAFRPMVLIAGGTGTVKAATGDSPAVLDTTQVYDPATAKFARSDPMTAFRDRHAAVVLPDGRILIVGGVATELVPLVSFPGPAMPWILSSTEILDPRDGHFSPAASMLTPRDEPTATLLRNGKVLVIGGGANGAELFDPKNDTFTVTGAMAESRYGQTATLLQDGKVLICGGGPRRAELYDPITGRFTPTGKMRQNRIYHTATLLPNGHILVAGGSPYTRSPALDSTEIYDPGKGTFRTGPNMERGRAGHTAMLLRDGRVLIAGGHEDNSAELYDPAAQRFVATLHMSVSRFGHSATLLPDGTVLIAGGWSPTYKPLASAEIYDPASRKFTAIGNMMQACAGHIAALFEVPRVARWIRPTSIPSPSATPTPIRVGLVDSGAPRPSLPPRGKGP
jgi:hypothetical protein